MQNKVTKMLLNSANQYPSKTALVHNDKIITFSELNLQVRSYAAHLKAKGIKKGERILIFVPVSIDLYRTILAVNYIGAVAVILDEWVSLKRMALCCEIAKCHAIITIPKAKILYLFSSHLRKIPLKLSTRFSKNILPLNAPSPTEEKDTALVTFTTGSTGTPKAAKRTYSFLYEQLKALQIELNPSEQDVTLLTLPIFTFVNLAIGATTIIESINQKNPDNFDCNRLYQTIIRNKVNSIICSPSYVLVFAKYCQSNQLSLPNLNTIYTGGAPIFPEDAHILHSAFPACNTQLLYGSTEAEPISSISAKELLNEDLVKDNGLNVGELYSGAKVKIIKIIDAPVLLKRHESIKKYEVSIGEVGEIIVCGHHVLKEYFNNELFERNKIIENKVIWHRTGDSGFFNKQGSLFLCGRVKTLISKQNTLYLPFVIESVFKQLNGVKLGTIIEHQNEIVAVFEVHKKADKNSIRKKVNALSFGFNSIEFVKKIPRDARHNSKIDYDTLKKQLLCS